MKKSLLSGLFWVLLLNLIVKPFWILGVENGVQNAVGTGMYGFYFAIFNLAYIFNILLDLGVTNFNTRNIARNPELIRKHLSGILSIKLMLLGLYVLVTFSAGLLMGYTSRQFYLLAWLTANQFLNSLILYLRSNYEGLLLFKWDSVLSVLDRVLMIAICGVLLWCPLGQGSFQIEWLAYAQTAAYVATAVVALAVLVRRTGWHGLHFNRPFTAAILKRSAPFALLVLLMATYNRIDPILITLILPGGEASDQAGLYAGAFRLLDAMTMIAYLVSVPLLPIYSKLTNEAARGQQPARDQIGSITQMMTSLMLVVSVTAAACLSAIREPMMAVMFPRAGTPSVEYAVVFGILIFGIIPIGMTYIYGTLLTANGNLKALNLLATTTLILNIAINTILIPRLGAVGSAIASLAAQSFMAVAQMGVAVRQFKLRPTLGYAVRILLFAALIVAGCFLAPPMAWWVALTLAGVVAVALAMLLKLLDIKQLISILKENENTKDNQ